MRILVEPSDYDLRNRGDAASLTVALDRIRRRWPDATMEVLTDDPDQLRVLAPVVVTRSTEGRRIWNEPLSRRLLGGRLSQRLGSYPEFLDAEVRVRWPEAAHRLPRTAAERATLDEYVEAVRSADLVVVTGMGGITDVFRQCAIEVLSTLALAVRSRVPTAMLSQQVGPITSRRLAHLVRQVLADVDLILLREGRLGRPLLHQLGVDLRRTRVTGDDAVPYVHHRRTDSLGAGLGINVRTAKYAGLRRSDLEPVRRVIKGAVDELGAPVVGLPVSDRPEEDDSAAIAQVTGQARPFPYPAITDLDGFVKLVQQCRLVVSGSYHAAVFALSQGIPAVGLSNSAYYDQKFLGLQALFGEGCAVVRLAPGHDRDVARAVRRLWAMAPDLRQPLLEAASQQVAWGDAAYRDLGTLVASPTARLPLAASNQPS
jgi:colanic acid/amylovoran biosynthesis protein